MILGTSLPSWAPNSRPFATGAAFGGSTTLALFLPLAAIVGRWLVV